MQILNKLSSIIDKSIKDLKIIFFISLKQLYIKIYLISFLILNSFAWGVVRFIDSEVDRDKIALHFNVESGIDYYGDTYKIYILPILGFLIFLINFILFLKFSSHKDRKFISHILFSMVIIVNTILLIGAISIYLVNFI